MTCVVEVGRCWRIASVVSDKEIRTYRIVTVSGVTFCHCPGREDIW